MNPNEYMHNQISSVRSKDKENRMHALKWKKQRSEWSLRGKHRKENAIFGDGIGVSQHEVDVLGLCPTWRSWMCLYTHKVGSAISIHSRGFFTLRFLKELDSLLELSRGFARHLPDCSSITRHFEYVNLAIQGFELMFERLVLNVYSYYHFLVIDASLTGSWQVFWRTLIRRMSSRLYGGHVVVHAQDCRKCLLDRMIGIGVLCQRVSTWFAHSIVFLM